MALAASANTIEKLLEDVYKFDREGKEKAIRQQRGFDVAALGMELYSKPLSQVNPALIRQLGISQKELAGLDEAEAKAKLEGALKGLQIKKLQKELKGANVVALPTEAALAGAEERATGLSDLNLKEEKYRGIINDSRQEAQYAAAIELAKLGEPVDSVLAATTFGKEYERILREKLKITSPQGKASGNKFQSRNPNADAILDSTDN